MTRSLTLLATGVLLAGLSACGTTESDDAPPPPAGTQAADGTDGTDGTETTATGATSCADDDTETSTEPVSLTDSLGRTVELDQPAQRIAVLEWGQIESALSLCVTPVAVADVQGYTTWDSAETLPDGVADVGTRGEPNLDALFRANPDLIIVEASGADEAVVDQFADYDVPVLATSGANAEDPIGQMTDTFELIAQATGREDRAAVVLEEMDTAIGEATAAIAEADAPTTEFVYFDGYVDGGNVALRPFGQGSFMGELGEAIGLTNAWTGEVDPVYGLGQSDIEGMTGIGDAYVINTSTVDESGDLTEALAGNPAWDRVPAVAEGRSRAFPPGVWTFGGPRSAVQIVDAYVDVFTG